MLEERNCKYCDNVFLTDVQYVTRLKCETCDDSEYITEKEGMEYCSMECLKKDNTILKTIRRMYGFK